MITGIRRRAFFLLSNVEKLPKYSSFISSLDSEILAWIRGSNAKGKLEMDESLQRGYSDLIAKNSKSTLQLILMMQSMLSSNKLVDNNRLDKKIKIDGLLEFYSHFLTNIIGYAHTSRESSNMREMA